MSSHSDQQCGTHNALTQLPSGVEQGTDKKLHPAGKTDSSMEKSNTTFYVKKEKKIIY